MAGSRASTTRSGGGRPAIDRQPAPQLTERFAADLARLWPEGGRLGLAVSGGPDSVALLLLARAVRPEQIEAATVDHGLRVEAAAEAQFVAELCAGLGVPHTILKVAVAEGNVQARARAARYAALAEWVDARGLAALATAHHADDQAETLLLRLNRGSGAAGLAGVRERGRIAGSALTVIRPLLGWRRSELAEVVARAGIEAIEDPSNADERFDRVRIRRALREADWLDPAALAASARNLADADAALDWAAGREWLENVRREGLGLTYRPSAPRAVALRVLARIVCELGGEEARGGAVARLFDSLAAGRPASIGDLVGRPGPDGWSFTRAPQRRA
jgi:tRNA(Ile)-lysidine synthase